MEGVSPKPDQLARGRRGWGGLAVALWKKTESHYRKKKKGSGEKGRERGGETKVLHILHSIQKELISENDLQGGKGSVGGLTGTLRVERPAKKERIPFREKGRNERRIAFTFKGLSERKTTSTTRERLHALPEKTEREKSPFRKGRKEGNLQCAILASSQEGRRVSGGKKRSPSWRGGGEEGRERGIGGGTYGPTFHEKRPFLEEGKKEEGTGHCF